MYRYSVQFDSEEKQRMRWQLLLLPLLAIVLLLGFVMAAAGKERSRTLMHSTCQPNLEHFENTQEKDITNIQQPRIARVLIY